MEVILISLIGFFFGWYRGRVTTKRNILKLLSSIGIRTKGLTDREEEILQEGIFNLLESIKQDIVSNKYLK